MPNGESIWKEKAEKGRREGWEQESEKIPEIPPNPAGIPDRIRRGVMKASRIARHGKSKECERI